MRDNAGSVEAWNNLGVAYAREGRLADAIAAYQSALRYNPEFTLSHLNLADALAKSGRVDEAIAHEEAALRTDPGNAAARTALRTLKNRKAGGE
ncbi:MAG: tetratricopeptide repeat protein [Verrucomicrobiota bacterium]